MNERKPLNVDACNLEEIRGVIRDINANHATLFDEMKSLRADHDALVARLEAIGARPT